MAEKEPITPAPGQEPAGQVDPPVVDPPEGEAPPAPTPNPVDDLPEWARKSISDAGKEAANYRIKAREEREAREAMQAQLAAAKSPEEFEAAVNDFNEKQLQADRKIDRLQAALAAGLSEDMVDRIQGDDYDAMLADAQFLAEKFGSANTPPPPPEPRSPSGGREPGGPPPAEAPGSAYRAARDAHKR